MKNHMSILKNFKYSKSFTAILIIMLIGMTSQTSQTYGINQKKNTYWERIFNENNYINTIKKRLMEKNTQCMIQTAKEVSKEITQSDLALAITTTGAAYQVHSVMTFVEDLKSIRQEKEHPACECDDRREFKPSQLISIAKFLGKSSTCMG